MVAAALAPGSSVEPVVVELPRVVFELLPRVDVVPGVTEGGPPIAVVPVEGVVLPRLPGAEGPASAVLDEPVADPTPVVDDAMPLLGVVVPSVLEPSACEFVVFDPHGAPSGTVCAIAGPAKASVSAAR